MRLALYLSTSAAMLCLFMAEADAAYNPSSFIAPGAANSVVPYPVLSYVTPQMFGAKCDGVTDDSTAMQTAETKAAAIHAEIHYPGGQCNFATTITPGVGVIHRGVGMGQTILNYTGTSHAFYLQNPNGTTLVQAPQFFDFTLSTPNITGTTVALQLNSIAGGFTDDNTTQDYMFQPIVQRVLFQGPSGAGIAFQCSKCFNLSITNSNFQYFATAVDVEGSDVPTISDNAMYNAGTQEILAQSHGTFGSELKISHNDMPGLLNNATSFINLHYRSEWIEYNHLEQDIPSISSVIDLDCSPGTNVTIQNNNIIATTSTTSAWLTEAGACIQFAAFNNYNQAGVNPPSAIFNSGNGTLYYYNILYQSIITSGANLNSNSGFPMNSVPLSTVTPVAVIPVSGQTIWEFNPNLPGMTTGDAGTTIYVKNDTFVIPPSLSSAVSLVDFQGPRLLPSGWDMWVCGYAGTSGQTIRALDGSSSPTQALTTTNTCYKMFSNDSNTPSTLSVQNADTTTNSNAFITEIKIVYH